MQNQKLTSPLDFIKPSQPKPDKGASVSEVQIGDKKLLEFPNQVSKHNVFSIPDDYLLILTQILSLNLKPQLISSKTFEDFRTLMSSLQNYQKLNSQEFINLNYLLIFYLEFKRLNEIANKLKTIIEAAEALWSPELKNSPRKRSFRVELNGKVNLYSESVPIIKRTLLFLSENQELSLGFKEKTLRRLSYDVTIFHKSDEKEHFTEAIMERNLQFFDQILWHCKNDTFLRYYEYKMAIEFVIKSFYSFIERKKLLHDIDLTEQNAEIVLNSKILDFCFKNQLRTIIGIITDSKEHVLLSKNHLLLSFKSGIYEHLKRHLKNKRLISRLSDFMVVIEIFKLKDNPKSFIDFLLFLYTIKDNDLSSEAQKLVFEEFQEFLSDSNKIVKVIYHMNPLMIFVALSQFFYRISKKCDNFHFSFVSFGQVLMKKCKEFIENYSDFDHLQTLVSNAYAPLEKSVLDMIFEDTDFFFSFFEEKRLSTIVKHNMDNSILYDFNFMDSSSIFNTLVENVDLKLNTNTQYHEIAGVDVIAEKMDRNDLNRKLKEKIPENWNVFQCIPDISNMNEMYDGITLEKNHFYQRKVFFSAISLRLLMDFLFFFGVFIYVLYFTQNYTRTNYFFQEIDPDYININSNLPLNNQTLQDALVLGLNSSYNATVYNYLLQTHDPSTYKCIQHLYTLSNSELIVEAMLQDCSQYQTLVSNYTDLNRNLYILFVIIIIMSGDLFLRKGYQLFVIKAQFLTALDVFELLNFIVCFIILMIYDTMSKYDVTVMDKTFSEKMQILTELLVTMSLFFALFLFLYWLKVTQYVKFWRKFGFIIKTIELMVRATTIFMVVYFIIIAAFCSVLYIIYSSNSNFSTYFDGLRNLFGFSLGQFGFEDDTSTIMDILISIILIVFLVISNIVMLNLLIAILSNIFSKLVSQIDLEISYNYYMLCKEYFFDEKYGHLTFFPRTFNFFLLPFHLLALYLAKPKLTLFLVDTYFTLYFMVIFIVYLVCSVLLIPFVWVKMFWLIIMNRYFDHCEKRKLSTCVRVFHFGCWLFGGLFYLIGVIFVIDLPIFIRSAYNDVVMPQKSLIGFQRLMQKYICNYLEKENLENNSSPVNPQLLLPPEREEKLKHKSFKENLATKLQKRGTLMFVEQQNNQKSSRQNYKNVNDYEKRHQQRLARICGGVEFEEALKIFNFAEELQEFYSIK